jgi:RimJ/RimL family protein N-acetyltransferase
MAVQPFLIRPGAADDAPDIGRILGLPDVAVPYFGCVPREADLARYLAQAWGASNETGELELRKVAIDPASGRVIGATRIEHQRITYFVHPAFVRHGIATALIRHVCGHVAAGGAAVISALIDRDNQHSIATAERAGFRFAGLTEACFGTSGSYRAMVRYTIRL